MALVRCDQHGRPEGRKGNVYVVARAPVGHPDSGVVCGHSSCDQPGMIWLLGDESTAYQRGQRTFSLQTAAAKVRAR